MMKNLRNGFVALVSLLVGFQINAAIKLPALFSDNMMLQQKSKAPIWGWADKNQTIKVKTSWDAKTYEVKADKEGKWKIRRPWF